MIIKDEIKKVIYNASNFHIIALNNGTRVKILFDPDFALKEKNFIQVNGEFKDDARYGQTFIADEIFEIEKEETFDLLSIAIDGIGEKKAQEILNDLGGYEILKTQPFKIFDYFLPKTSKDILEQIRDKRHLFVSEDKEVIAKQMNKEIKGIGKKKILSWMEKFEETYPYDTQLFLDDDSLIYFLASDTALKVYDQIKHIEKLEKDYKTILNFNIPDYSINYLFKEFKFDTFEKITENPYIMLDYGVGFILCDKIAVNEFEVKKDSYIRIINGILYVLKQNEKEGNTFMKKDKCIEDTIELLELEKEIIENSLDIELSKNYDAEFVLSDDNIYRRVIYFTERKLGNMLYLKTIANKNVVPEFIKKYLEGSKLSKEQQNSVFNLLSDKIAILTGGPGTGKTTTINELCNCLDKMNKRYLLCAPTGRAAKRMTESTGREAQTIHRLLEYKPRGMFSSFGRNERYQLWTDYIIVDESSMLDVYILNSLIKAVKNETSIIFVGDIDQLPSISMGSVFRDMKDSGKINTYELTEVFRQSLNSYIVRNAYHIKNNEELEINDSDFKFEKVETFEAIKEKLETYDFDFQILCPMRVSNLGTIKINQLMQNIKNSNPDGFYFNNRMYKLGDKVIQNDNDYNKEVYNGEIGIIEEIDNEKIVVNYPYNTTQHITYKQNETYEIDLSYAISIHKSQGSEAENIVLIVDGNKDFISKELIYTAVTRAKKNIILLSTYDLSFYSELTTSNNRMTNLNNTIK